MTWESIHQKHNNFKYADTSTGGLKYLKWVFIDVKRKYGNNIIVGCFRIPLSITRRLTRQEINAGTLNDYQCTQEQRDFHSHT